MTAARDELVAAYRAGIRAYSAIETPGPAMLHDLIIDAILAARFTRHPVVIHTGDQNDRLAAWNEGFTEAQKQWAESEPQPRESGTISIPRPHVPYGPTHVSEEAADADYLRAAVRNIKHLSQGERIWGSNLTATIVKLLNDSAAAVEALTPSTEETP